jgi:hypothetical protein
MKWYNFSSVFYGEWRRKMSDALSEIERDRERRERFEIFERLKEKYAHNPTIENREAVIKAAKSVDEIKGGYFLSKRYHTNYSHDIEVELYAIIQGP